MLQDSATLNCHVLEPSHPDSLDPARRVILDWLIKTARCNKITEPRKTEGMEHETDTPSMALWERKHCKLLAQLSMKYFDFFKEHFQYLVCKTKEIEKCRAEETFNLHSSSTASKGSMAEWAISQWVELALIGEQPREVCIAFLQSQVSPCAQSEGTITKCNEFSYAGLTFDPSPPPTENIWTELLRTVLSSCKYKMKH